MSVEGIRELAEELNIPYLELFDFRIKMFGSRKFINLSELNLIELPKSLMMITEIAILNLEGNRLIPYLNTNKIIETTDNSNLNLMQVRNINIARNELESLPTFVKRLYNLEVLQLMDNKLKLLPSWLFFELSLKQLLVSHNQIETLGKIPHDHLLSSSLMDIDLSFNRLTSLPSILSHLDNLQTLNLSFNRIRDLQEDISVFNLTSLNLNGNQLTELPDLSEMTSLFQLFVAFNSSSLIHPDTSLPDLYLLHFSITNLDEINIALLQHLIEINHIVIYSQGRLNLLNVIEKAKALYRLIGAEKTIVYHANDDKIVISRSPFD